MLSNQQKALLKRAQRDAQIPDAEYRGLLSTLSGFSDCSSSTDPRLTDAHWDNLLSFFEAIYWRCPTRRISQIFRKPGYWANKNQRGNTSRDRYTAKQLTSEIAGVESRLLELGVFGRQYLDTIQRRCKFDDRAYLAALRRTLNSKEPNEPACVQFDPENCPF